MAEPKTIHELRKWVNENIRLPEYQTRFYIGKNMQNCEASGIYKEHDNFFVYRNEPLEKERKFEQCVLYSGQSEEKAVMTAYTVLCGKYNKPLPAGEKLFEDNDNNGGVSPKLIKAIKAILVIALLGLLVFAIYKLFLKNLILNALANWGKNAINTIDGGSNVGTDGEWIANILGD